MSDTGFHVPPAKAERLATVYSTAPDKERGGNMGLFARGIQPKAIENTAFRLKPGQVSPARFMADSAQEANLQCMQLAKWRSG